MYEILDFYLLNEKIFREIKLQCNFYLSSESKFMFISTFEFLRRPQSNVEAMKVLSFTKNCVKSFFYIEFYNELI